MIFFGVYVGTFNYHQPVIPYVHFSFSLLFRMSALF